MEQAVICIFAKPPEAGKVKTRLIPELGEQRAAELAEAFLQDTVAMVRECPWAKCAIAATEHFERDYFLPDEVWLQGEGDLGMRLERIFRRGLRRFEMVFAVGADSPGLRPSYLARAREELASADAVLGGARDGGFYLLGMKKCPEGILDQIQWSHSQTYTETVTQLHRKGWKTASIDSWFDIDTPEDLRRVLPKMESALSSAPSTLALLRKWYPEKPFCMKISVVIPALNEVEGLPRLIAGLQEMNGIAEIIVADGGSTDGTREWVLSQQGILLIDSPRGKGLQLNAGAARATGDVLLFLHADCQMNREAWRALQAAVAAPQTAGGAFHIRFAEKAPALLRLVEKGINARTTITRTATGDQGIFVRRTIFSGFAGAPNWPLFEDVELVRRIKKTGRFAIVTEPLTISGRRYIENGVLQTALLIFALRLGFWLGVSPYRLKAWFKDVRKGSVDRKSRRTGNL